MAAKVTRQVLLLFICFVALVSASSKLAQVGEWTALAHITDKRPATFPVSEASVNTDRPAPVVESGIVTMRKLAIEGVLEICGIMVCLVLMATKSMKFCDPPSPGNITGLLAVLVLIKLSKSIMTAFRTFPRSISCESGCPDLSFSPGLWGVVQKLGIGDMLWVGVLVAASLMTIGYHYPFCSEGNTGLPDDVFLAFTGLLIINLVQTVGTIAHVCVWGHSQIEQRS